jgi:uncharacterized membrane protein HdeD (DUF308 family)
MKMGSKTVTGMIYMVLGILCLILRSDIVMYAALCVGIALFVFGILELTKERVTSGVICLICGIAIMILGWLMVSIILYIIAIAAVVIGIVRLTQLPKREAVNDSIFRPDIYRPLLMILCGILLFVNQRAAVSAVFIAIGILLIVAGIFAMVEEGQ